MGCHLDRARTGLGVFPRQAQDETWGGGYPSPGQDQGMIRYASCGRGTFLYDIILWSLAATSTLSNFTLGEKDFDVGLLWTGFFVFLDFCAAIDICANFFP